MYIYIYIYICIYVYIYINWGVPGPASLPARPAREAEVDERYPVDRRLELRDTHVDEP